MSAGKQQNNKEKRSYFRVDDVISVVANPVNLINKKDREKIRTAASSQVFSLFDDRAATEIDEQEMTAELAGDKKLYGMLKEIKTKLDFIINHFMLEKEGLLSAEKRPVNISASGVKFTIRNQVKEKDILEVKLLLPTFPPVAVFAYGEVKRVKALDDQTYEVALEYLNMGESVRNEIIQYTLNHQRETIRRSKERGADE